MKNDSLPRANLTSSGFAKRLYYNSLAYVKIQNQMSYSCMHRNVSVSQSPAIDASGVSMRNSGHGGGIRDENCGWFSGLELDGMNSKPSTMAQFLLGTLKSNATGCIFSYMYIYLPWQSNESFLNFHKVFFGYF